MKQPKKIFIFSTVFIALNLFMHSAHSAVIGVSWIGGGSPGTSVDFTVIDSDTIQIDILTEYDPNVGPIIKTFITDGQGGSLTLHEDITNTGETPWGAWNEACDTDAGNGNGCYWVSAEAEGHGGDFGPVYELLDTDITDDGIGDILLPGVKYTFSPPFFNGDTVSLTKEITYDPGVLEFYVYEWPSPYEPASAVPVPAAAWLFGSALIGLAGLKRKK